MKLWYSITLLLISRWILCFSRLLLSICWGLVGFLSSQVDMVCLLVLVVLVDNHSLDLRVSLETSISSRLRLRKFIVLLSSVKTSKHCWDRAVVKVKWQLSSSLITQSKKSRSLKISTIFWILVKCQISSHLMRKLKFKTPLEPLPKLKTDVQKVHLSNFSLSSLKDARNSSTLFSHSPQSVTPCATVSVTSPPSSTVQQLTGSPNGPEMRFNQSLIASY